MDLNQYKCDDQQLLKFARLVVEVIYIILVSSKFRLLKFEFRARTKRDIQILITVKNIVTSSYSVASYRFVFCTLNNTERMLLKARLKVKTQRIVFQQLTSMLSSTKKLVIKTN